MEINDILDLIGNIGAPAAAVVLSMKYAINGMREDVTEIKQDVKEIKGTVTKHTVEIAVLKAKEEVA